MKPIISPIIHKLKPHPDFDAEKEVNKNCLRILDDLYRRIVLKEPMVDPNEKYIWNVKGRSK